MEITVDGEPFVACNECAFPVCRPCYEYERREGNQACPQCKTRYKRIKGETVFFPIYSFIKPDFLPIELLVMSERKLQVVLGLMVMRKKMALMIWSTNLILRGQ